MRGALGRRWWMALLLCVVAGNSIAADAKSRAPSRAAYDREVRRETERSYRQHRDTIDPGRTRGKGYDLDHSTPRGAGYRQGIPPSVIGAPSNLKMLPSSQNRSEGCRGFCR